MENISQTHNDEKKALNKLKEINLDTIEELPEDLINLVDRHVIITPPEEKNLKTYSICKGQIFYEDQDLRIKWLKELNGNDKDEIIYIYYDGDGGRKIYFHPKTRKKLFDTKYKK